jgi:hypothetical protein
MIVLIPYTGIQFRFNQVSEKNNTYSLNGFP